MTVPMTAPVTAAPILVIGATGKTGRRIADRLEAAGHPVRRGARRSATPFDWDRPETWAPALDGVRAAYISYFPDLAFPGAEDKIAGLVEAARAAGVGRLVLLSGRGEHHAERCEALVRDSGLDHTLVRAAWFAQNFSEGYLRDAVLAGTLALPAGAVVEPIVDVDDIADVAVAALTEDGHNGRLYDVTGPELLGFDAMAAQLAATLGRPVIYRPITLEQFREAMAATARPMVADVFTAICREVLDGRNAHIGHGIEHALGRPPRRFAAFCHAAFADGAWAEAPALAPTP
jgi:uncharacterized protein YbjT (DUF2867 family)